jgi:multiple sugar transport system permease protein
VIARGRRDAVPLALLAPALLLVLLVHVAPVLLGIELSLLRLTQPHLANWTGAPFAGLDNYRTGLNPSGVVGSELLDSLARTAAFVVIVVGVSWCLGMLAAVLLAAPFRGRALLQAFFLIPFAMPAYASALAWRSIFDRDTGMLNHLIVDDLHLRGDRPFWLIGPNAFWATVIVAAWRLWPFAYLVLAAALRTVPGDQYRAAAVDGAGAWAQFRRITLPATRRASVLVALVGALWAATDFGTPYLLFGATPPAAATLLANLIYRAAFVDFDLGVASALNVAVTLLLLVLGGLCAWRALARTVRDA